MALEKLKIKPDNQAQPIEVLFNPNSYSISKAVTWTASTNPADKCVASEIKLNAPTLRFGGGGARNLTLDLFFDTTDDPTRDVRLDTDRIVKLTRIMRDRANPRPPTCTIFWGAARTVDFPFKGVVSNLEQSFTLFHESGHPLRATLKVTFTEFVVVGDDVRETDPELTTRTVRRGDTLASIAADFYRDPALWRVIAVANGIEDPFAVLPGTKLTLPKR